MIKLKKAQIVVAVSSLLLAYQSNSSAETAIIEFGETNFDGLDVSKAFSLGAVKSIDAITIELSANQSRDVRFNLISPTGDVFDLLDRSGNTDDFFGDRTASLTGVGTYSFVDSGIQANQDAFDWFGSSAFNSDGSLDEDTYITSAWRSPDSSDTGLNGTHPNWGDEYWQAGEWNVIVADSGFFDDAAVGAVGNVTINYTGDTPAGPGPGPGVIPEPSTALCALLAYGLLATRRRRA